MFYVSRDYENNTYGITDTSDNTEEIHSLNDILNIISSTGIKIHGVSKKGIRAFKDLKALYNFELAKFKLMGCDGVIEFDNGIIKLSKINNKNTTNYVVPDFIMSLGDNCFNGCSSLQSIEIPDSVTKIGVRCFCNCHSLKNITISKSLYNKSYIEHFIRFNGEIKFWA